MSGNYGLVLTRHHGQNVHLFTETGQEIIVTFLGAAYNGEARISIKADKEIRIVRGEIIGKVPTLSDSVGMDENRGNR